MAAVFGRIEEYDGKKEEWPQYVERLSHYFKANNIDDPERQRDIFLTLIGPGTYKLLRSLLQPTKPTEKTFEDLTAVLTLHFKPTPSEIVQRFRFHTRFRKQEETVALYVAELKVLAEYCNFGDTLEAMLRDRLVCGINNEKIQNRLLSEPNLTYQKAMSLAQSLEAAASDLKELQKKRPDGDKPPVNKVVLDQTKKGVCYRCGKEGHLATKCRYKDAVCHQCGKPGHIRPACRSKPKKPTPTKKKPHNKVDHVEGDQDGCPGTEYPLHNINTLNGSHPLEAEIEIDGKQVVMEIDTGAAFSLMSEKTFRELWPDGELESSNVRLSAYTGTNIPVAGSKDVTVHYKNQVSRLPLIVVKGEGSSLFGRNWLHNLRLHWAEIKNVSNGKLPDLLQEYSQVFDGGLGTLKDFQAKIHINPEAKPRFSKARSVSYAFRDKVEAKLQSLVEEDILEPVEFSEWASPIVAVLKADKQSVRICGDFKQTINPVSKLDTYPIPRIEDLFAKLSGGKSFTTLDLSRAYHQLPLDEESRKYVVINTQKGLFRYKRLPYGVSSAPSIFQRTMENLLGDIRGVVVYIDDILVTGSTTEIHLQSLEEVLRRLKKAGLRAHMNKCKFMAPSVTYLGYRIDAEGLHPLAEKVEAIHGAPPPSSVPELKSYLGLLTYYSKFLPNMATVLAPLYRLLRKDVKWSWKQPESKAFEASKKLLTSSNVLAHFDPSLQIVLSCDASSYGVGAVLAHKMPDGSERPVGYASRTLTSAERNYSQLEREGLACIFGIKRFHSFIFGRHFDLITDHKPLLALLHQHKSTSEQASARIRRWSLFMSTYEYSIHFRKTQEHGNADALSRLPLPEKPAQVPVAAELVLLIDHLNNSPVTAKQIETWTRKDPVLSTVLQYVHTGWPERCREEFKPYFSKSTELSVHQGCLLWGSRVVVPPKAREAILAELHEGHPGMTRMKALSRMYVWWPGLDKAIEQKVSACDECQMLQSNPPVTPLHPWDWPTRPWARLHIDFAGPLFGKMFLVVIDAHSKWIEAFPTASSTSTTVIEHLRTLFATFGLPETIVSDNGSCFVSGEFAEFLRANGVKHITSAPYHPATNGLAERAVQIVKKGLKKVTDGSLQSRIARILCAYRITPQSTTGESPAKLLLGRQPKTRLDLVKPSVGERVASKQLQQKNSHDSSSCSRRFQVGDSVYAKNFGQGQRWLPSKVTEVTGPVSFMVQLQDGRIIRRHQDHLRIRRNENFTLQEPQEVSVPDVPLVNIPESSVPVLEPSSAPAPVSPEPDPLPVDPPPTTPPEEPTPIPVSTPKSSTPRKSYPNRIRKHPDWLDGPRNS